MTQKNWTGTEELKGKHLLAGHREIVKQISFKSKVKIPLFPKAEGFHFHNIGNLNSVSR